jgi:hypothetical protein
MAVFDWLVSFSCPWAVVLLSRFSQNNKLGIAAKSSSCGDSGALGKLLCAIIGLAKVSCLARQQSPGLAAMLQEQLMAVHHLSLLLCILSSSVFSIQAT